MLQSILHDDVQYIQNKLVSKNDIGKKVNVYDVELFGVQMAISIGELVDTYIDKMIYYCPVYVIINQNRVEKIGYFEFYKKDLSIITDSDGDIDISLLLGPLTFNYIDGDYLINLINRDNFLKTFILEEKEFNKITLQKTKQYKKDKKDKKSKKADADADADADDADADADADTDATNNKSITSKESKTMQYSETKYSIQKSLREIPNIDKIIKNGESKLNEELLNKSRKLYLEDIKKYKNDYNNWIQNHYKNNFFDILDVEANGDCFFATIREAFKTMGVTITVDILRNLLANNVTKEQFEENRILYNDFKKALLSYKKEHDDISAKINDINQKKSQLIEEGKKNQNDRTKIRSIGKKNNNLTEKLNILTAEKKRVTLSFMQAKILFNDKKFMKNIKTFQDYKSIINTTKYWADEVAISILEFLLNIKVIIISEEKYENGDLDILSCGTTILTPIEKRKEFNPKYYMIVNHTGNHYKLIKYKNQGLFTFYDLPNIIRENIKSTCSTGLFNYIPIFNQYFKKSK